MPGAFWPRPTVVERALYSITDARNVPRPIRSGGPPIMIGGSGERRTLRLVAQYADMCNVLGRPDHRSRHSSTCCAGTARRGRDPSEGIVTTRSHPRADDSSQERPRHRLPLGHGRRRVRRAVHRRRERTRSSTRSARSSPPASTSASSTCRSPTPSTITRAGDLLTAALRIGWRRARHSQSDSGTPDARLLIVNCDDLGSSRAANVAIYEALRDGVATSATLMVPCPWARDSRRDVPR